MSMITGCPACGTMFKVVADQLKISEGWVRCGHCAEVFDASAHMQPEPPVAHVERSDTVAAELLHEADPGPGESMDRAAGAATLAPPGEGPPVEIEPPGPPLEASELPLTPWSAPSGFGPSSQSFEESSYLPVHLVRAESEGAAARIDADGDDTDDDVVDDDLPLEDVSFVRQARRKAFWRRPPVRVALALVLLALAVLLVAQVAVQDRDRLASAEPGLRPLLERLCEPLGCRIGPPRRIEAIAIDSSGFTKLRQDTYRLTVTLKNQDPLPVAMPALELTLTDSQDQPVVRRVLMPPELGARVDTIASAGDWSASVALAVDGSSAARVAGYRLLAFYP